jgi:hypothetical protein
MSVFLIRQHKLVDLFTKLSIHLVFVARKQMPDNIKHTLDIEAFDG